MTSQESIRVGVVGAAGRMGAAVCEAVQRADHLDLAAAVDPGGHDADEKGGPKATAGPGAGVPVVTDLMSLVDNQVDVAVDFTTLDAARKTLPWLAGNGIHAVVGTTGFTDDDIADFGGCFTASNCLIAPNFSISAVLMMRFAELAAPHFDTAEIIELHHDAKIDAPSGTAMRTAERMAGASSDWAADATEHEVVAGARGGLGPGGIHVHSVRMRGMVAHQEVILGATGQSLTLRQDSYDRSSFMPGVVLAVRRVGSTPGVTVGLDALLDI